MTINTLFLIIQSSVGDRVPTAGGHVGPNQSNLPAGFVSTALRSCNTIFTTVFRLSRFLY